MAESRLNIRISPDKKEELCRKVAQEGKNLTDVMMGLIEEYLKSSSTTDTTDEFTEIKKRLDRLEFIVLGE